jgi:hypothetical protein
VQSAALAFLSGRLFLRLLLDDLLDGGVVHVEALATVLCCSENLQRLKEEER